MTIRSSDRQRPDPHVLVLDEVSLRDDDRTWFAPEEVHLVIEVVSPASKALDTGRKAQLYAEARIRHFWWVGDESGPVIHTYELDRTTRRYESSGVHREMVTLSAPFPIKIDVRGLTQWRPVRLA